MIKESSYYCFAQSDRTRAKLGNAQQKYTVALPNLVAYTNHFMPYYRS